MIAEAYYPRNTSELRAWLRELGLAPIAYPDCERPGLTAPYCGRFYCDGLRYEDDDDVSEFVICEDENQFKNKVKEIMRYDCNVKRITK